MRDGGFVLFCAGKWGGDGSDGLAGKPLSLMEGRIGQIRYRAPFLMANQMVMVMVVRVMRRIVVITLFGGKPNQSQQLK